MKYLIILLVIFISGCGPSEPNNNNNGYGWEYDYISEAGLLVRNKVNFDLSFYKIDEYFEQVKTCVGVDDFSLMIIFQDQAIKGHEEKYGYTYFSPLLVVINTIYLYNMQSLIKHEMIHAALVAKGIPDEDNANHNSYYFNLCNNGRQLAI